jgi:hypothetical protein
MTCYIKSATSVYDVDSNMNYIELVYDRFIKRDNKYDTYVDYMYTEPNGDWTKINCNERSISYMKFMDTMVKRTVEVQQKIAELTLETLLTKDYDCIRLAHSSKILDPTFQPPIINMNSAWQVDFMRKFCKKYLADIIQECTNPGRLDYFINVLNMIQSEI